MPLAVTNYDHNERNVLRSLALAAPDWLAGFASLARQWRKQELRKYAAMSSSTIPVGAVRFPR